MVHMFVVFAITAVAALHDNNIARMHASNVTVGPLLDATEKRLVGATETAASGLDKEDFNNTDKTIKLVTGPHGEISATAADSSASFIEEEFHTALAAKQAELDQWKAKAAQQGEEIKRQAEEIKLLQTRIHEYAKNKENDESLSETGMVTESCTATTIQQNTTGETRKQTGTRKKTGWLKGTVWSWGGCRDIWHTRGTFFGHKISGDYCADCEHLEQKQAHCEQFYEKEMQSLGSDVHYPCTYTEKLFKSCNDTSTSANLGNSCYECVASKKPADTCTYQSTNTYQWAVSETPVTCDVQQGNRSKTNWECKTVTTSAFYKTSTDGKSATTTCCDWQAE